MAVLFANSAKSTLAANLSSGATLLAIDEDDAWKFPSPSSGDWFPLTIFDAAGNIEYVKCTGRAAAILTIVRAQEGTTAKAFIAGSGVSHRLTAAALQAMRDTQSNALDDAVSTLEDSISEAFNSLSTRVDDIVGAPPTALNSLQKLSDAIGGDDEFATTIASQIADAARLTSGTVPNDRFPPRLSPYSGWYPGYLGHITDYNLTTESGHYFGRADASNAPPGAPWCVVSVSASAANMLRQDAYDPNNKVHWFRYCHYDGSTVWDASWSRVYETAAEIQSIIPPTQGSAAVVSLTGATSTEVLNLPANIRVLNIDMILQVGGNQGYQSLLQLGTASSYATSGYQNSELGVYPNSVTTGIDIGTGAESYNMPISVRAARLTGNLWAYNVEMPNKASLGGTITLATDLTRLKYVKTAGAAPIANSQMKVSWEF